MKKYIILLLILGSCKMNDAPQLPFLGNKVRQNGTTDYPKIADFSFTDQNDSTVTNHTFKGRIYVADFIFLSCPMICPKMNTEMLKVYTAFKNNNKVGFLSHTIDPEHDTVEKLKAYTDNLGIKGNWHFVTGNKDSIFSIATKSYFTTAYPNAKEPGGYIHGGGLLLIDKNRYIRGVYDGTNPKESERLIKDINTLLKE